MTTLRYVFTCGCERVWTDEASRVERPATVHLGDACDACRMRKARQRDRDRWLWGATNVRTAGQRQPRY